MKAIQKRARGSSASRSDPSGDMTQRSGPTVRSRKRNFRYPEVWGYLRPKQTECAFECRQCAERFPNVAELRRHQLDCVSEDANEPV
ncbi:MAG TPA: hypothetical protein VNN13_02135 [Methylomirabilota bacterium]|nr:hypothetical protein [Methylomirabilota bacterium]